MEIVDVHQKQLTCSKPQVDSALPSLEGALAGAVLPDPPKIHVASAAGNKSALFCEVPWIRPVLQLVIAGLIEPEQIRNIS